MNHRNPNPTARQLYKREHAKKYKQVWFYRICEKRKYQRLTGRFVLVKETDRLEKQGLCFYRRVSDSACFFLPPSQVKRAKETIRFAP